VFDYLTISAVIENRVFCVHGGLSPSVTNIDDVKISYIEDQINR
jgi:diadenosine tetraphosphatase ApaH/serine/threonine PP2A family protein phosphatase